MDARPAGAQACCAGSAVLTPGRLERHEWLLVGTRWLAGRGIGSFDGDARFAPPLSDSSAWDFEQQWFATTSITARGQFGVLVPTLQSLRSAPNVEREFGAGLGDVQAALRWDALFAGESSLPGVALLLRITLPTGRSPDEAQRPLGSDVTGSGATELSGGVAIEEDVDAFRFTLSTELRHAFPHSTGSLRVEPGLEVLALLGGSFAWNPRWSSALVLSQAIEGRSRIDGRLSSASSSREFELTLSQSYTPNNDVRFFAALFTTPPLDGPSKNRPATLGLSLGAVASFW